MPGLGFLAFAMVVVDFLSILAALKGYANCLNSKGHAKQFQSLESIVEQTKRKLS